MPNAASYIGLEVMVAGAISRVAFLFKPLLGSAVRVAINLLLEQLLISRWRRLQKHSGRTLKSAAFLTGSMKMEATDIRSFAKKFDPQPYHLDREAGEASLFGGLCASGWHVTAVMMKLVSDQLARE